MGEVPNSHKTTQGKSLKLGKTINGSLKTNSSATDESRYESFSEKNFAGRKLIIGKNDISQISYENRDTLIKGQKSNTSTNKSWLWNTKRQLHNNQTDLYHQNKRKEVITDISKEAVNLIDLNYSKLPVWKRNKFGDIQIATDTIKHPIKFDNNTSLDIFKNSKVCKVPPTVPPKSSSALEQTSTEILEFHKQVPTDLSDYGKIIQKQLDNGQKFSDDPLESQSDIERFQQNLGQVNSTTTETNKKKLPTLHAHVFKVSVQSDIDLNQDSPKVAFDGKFLLKNNLDNSNQADDEKNIKTSENLSDTDKIVPNNLNRPKYSKEVLEVEKRWSGEFLENHLKDHNSSESSKSSYIEEAGSISSYDSYFEESQLKSCVNQTHSSQKGINEFNLSRYSGGSQEVEEATEDTLSTIDSTSCLEDRIKSIESDDTDAKILLVLKTDENESKESTLKESSVTEIENSKELLLEKVIEKDDKVLDNSSIEIVLEDDTECDSDKTIENNNETDFVNKLSLNNDIADDTIDIKIRNKSTKSDGYALLIQNFTMDPGSSKLKDEKKKRSGLRRLLPGLFSPKDSRKVYKKDQKEKKRRDERYFHQHQQNGIYTRSPDTLHLNEDIKRNVNLDTSLSGTLIEERLNEIKQELFSEPGMITSTPDHFLQDDRIHIHDRRAQRFFNNNSSLSSIAIDEKWIENQNIISGSPDIRKIKYNLINETGRKCNLERKLSFQESQSKFVRNHGPSGRISAPPSERYLIRPRAIHPMDRPLPAIPQKMEFTNYENQDEMCLYSRNNIHDNSIKYQVGYYSVNRNYVNQNEFHENKNLLDNNEINRNLSNDSGFNLTPVSRQTRNNRQFVMNQQNQQENYEPTKHEKYSPSSSQKSGDYADSSYTPNSSQKSEFSPGSSKSGEYYLNSPRTDSRMSPDENLNDRRDQLNQDLQKSPNNFCESGRTSIKDNRIYDEAARSPYDHEKNSIHQRTINQNGNLDISYSQKGSPNIPLSMNLAKLRANVENSTQSIINSPEKHQSFENLTNTSPVKVSDTPVLAQGINCKSPLSNTSKVLYTSDPRIVSPLSIVTPSSASSCIYASPTGPNKGGTGTPVSAKDVQFSTPISSLSIKQSKISNSGLVENSQSRKAQPTDQILIVSPKRELFFNAHRSPNSTEGGCPDSPVPIADSPCNEPNLRHNFLQNIRQTKSPTFEVYQQPPPHAFRDITVSQQPKIIVEQLSSSHDKQVLHEPEPEVSDHGQNDRQDEVRPERVYNKNSPKRNATPEPIYDQSTKYLSPSKKQTRQCLEAYYWQQKALETHKSEAVSSNSLQTQEPSVREAIYWQQLKKLNEEQQKKIFERNQFGEKNNTGPGNIQKQCPISSQKMISCSSSSLQSTDSHNHMILQSPHGSEKHQSENLEKIYWNRNEQPANNINHKTSNSNNHNNINNDNKDNSTGNNNNSNKLISSKPPLSGQKILNQPILIVRPQQAVRETNESLFISDHSSSKQPLKSTDLSSNFIRNDERRSLQLFKKYVTISTDGLTDCSSPVQKTPLNQDETDTDRRQPPPIFKRGSLISNSSSSMEYGSIGPKRVSFSNQSNCPEIGSGNWPTKYGMAPEPPTRKNKIDEKCLSQNVTHENDQNIVNNIYGNTMAPIQHHEIIYPSDYDANRPLPPPPEDSSININSLKKSNCWKDSMKNQQKADTLGTRMRANPRKFPGISESESGSEAGEVQRILQQRYEEEWNAGGKGRQNNDIGGSGRAEGEGGSNELPGGRRSGVLGSGRASGSSGGGGRSRDEPRRHTLSGDHGPSLHHQQFNAQQLHPLHPHHLPPPHGQYGTPTNRHTTMDLEMGTKSRQRKAPFPRGYPPPSSTMLFDDDPGIMSEVETSSTGFRRGGKQRSSLPVVRTPSKTLERPLGLVFLQYRKETKRALLPNEITSIDTVKALFVRSFPKQLTMEYLDSPEVKIYIHDSSKDMFYELEDHRSHLRDIRDRSVLRLIEKNDGLGGMSGPLGAPIGGPHGLPPHWEDQSYFSEPEFDSEFQHQHIHKSKTAKNSSSGNYYMGGSSTLPRGGPIMRAYSPAASAILAGPNATPTQPKTLGTPGGGGGGGVAPAKPLRGYQCGKTPLGNLRGSARFSRDSSVSLYSIPDRLHGESGYMSSPERGGGASSGRYPAGPYSTGSSYEEPYYSQYSGTVTPVIDEEASDTELLEESYSLYGVKPSGRPPSGPPRSPFPPGAPALPTGPPYDVTRIRVEHMERQLANLTGLVQKALTHAPHTSPSPRDYLQVPPGRDPYARSAGAGDEFDKHSSSSSASLPDDSYLRTDVKPPKLGKDKSVSFEKSVSFSDEPPDMNSPKQHSPQHAADTKPTKPAIKSSTLPRMSSQERDRHKPTPPPKPVALGPSQYVYRDLALTPEMYNHLRGLQKKAKDLRQEVRNLRRLSQAQAHTVRESIRDTFITIRATLLSGGDMVWTAGDSEKMRLNREEDLYKQEMIRLEKDLTELESTVEELRGNVINRKTRVNMSDVENMALILSKSSKTVADLKVRFPNLQEGMKGLLSSEMEKVVREEKFLKEEPERLESALRRCKKLTGTLVTLKRLASVQEQRLPNAVSLDSEETPPITPSSQHSKTTAPVPAERTVLGSTSVIGGGSYAVESSAAHQQRPENALDALLDELQTFSRPSSQLSQVSNSSQPSLNHIPNMLEIGRSASQIVQSTGRAPNISDIGRKGSIDSSSSLAIITTGSASNTLRRLHSYPSSSDTDTSPPIARIQVSDGTIPPQKPPVPERNAELLQLATARRVPPPPPPRTSSRSPLASPTSPQLPPRNPTGTLRRGRPNAKDTGKPPMALPPNANNINSNTNTISNNNNVNNNNNNNINNNNINSINNTSVNVNMINNNNNNNNNNNHTTIKNVDEQSKLLSVNNILSTSNSSSCESINSQEGMQSKKDRQEQLEQRHQELLRKQKALQEQYTRLQQLQRNTSGLTTVPPTPPDLLKKTGSESNILAKMGLGMSAANSGSLTSLAAKNNNEQSQTIVEDQSLNSNNNPSSTTAASNSSANATSTSTPATVVPGFNISPNNISNNTTSSTPSSSANNTSCATLTTTTTTITTTTTNKIYETDIL